MDFDFPGRDRLDDVRSLPNPTADLFDRLWNEENHRRVRRDIDAMFARLLGHEVMPGVVVAEDGRRVDHLDVVRAIAAKHLP